MRRGFIRWRLRRWLIRLLLTGVGLVWFVAPFVAFTLWGAINEGFKGKGLDLLSSAVFLGGVVAFGVGLAWWSGRALDRLKDHPDLLTLDRYGPREEVLAAIDGEVYGKPRPLRLGTLLRFYVLAPAPGDLRGHQVLITASWLIHLWGEDGHRVDVVRLEDLVAAFRTHSVRREQIASTLTLLDRHNVRVQVPGTTAGIRRLLAEVQARAPWALERFDHEIERNWNEAPAKVVAEMMERREQFRRADLRRDPPPPPA